MSNDLLIGIHAVEAALNHDVANLVELYIETGSQNPRVKELGERARELGVKPHARDRAALDRMTGGARHQGVVARYDAPAPLPESALADLAAKAGQDALFLVLDGMLDVEVDGEVVAEVGPGAVLGVHAALEGGRRTATLRAATRCRVVVVAQHDLDPAALAAIASGQRREATS